MKGKWRLPWRSKRLLFLLPGFSGVMLFYLLPFFEVARRSFLKAGNNTFVGVDNYRAVLENGAFVLALRNTLLYMAVGVPLLMGISLLLSLLLRNLALRRRLVSAMLLPMAVPAAVMVLTLQILIDRQGVINGVLTNVSEKMAALPVFSAIDYLNTEWALVVVVCSFLWKNTGYMVILWLAGLAALPKEVEEAAQVDGAGRWQRWHYIIRPGLSGSFFTIGMLSVLQIFKSYREVWMVAGSYPQEHIYFLQHLLQNWYLKLEFDRMAALTVLLSLVLLLVCLLLQHEKRF
ncbi:MAG: sugar ABC transporter permease [Lachnospiraceae bacterium]|nr:sugar ABC transporter permease [Lachnospiraceae bacterium]